jgi:hypothetical protein
MNERDRDQSQRQDRGQGPFEKIGEGVGGLAGRAAGQATDVVVNAAGSLMNAAMESLGDWWSSDSAREASDRFDARRDQRCRQHFQSEGGSSGSASYDSARPLYQFGHVAGQNPDYQGRSFEEVEPELRGAWREEHSERFGEWPEVRGYVGFGYSAADRDDPLA